MTQHIYKESGVSIDLSAYAHFRFENCEGYRKIKGCNVKEIDFGWWNEEEECLYLLELKDFTANPERIVEKEKSVELIENLCKKSIDVVLMLSAVWLDNAGGREIKPCLPARARQKCKMKIFHLVRCDESIEPALNAMNDKLKNEFRGYRQLYENLLTFKIISARQADRIFKDLLFY